MDIYRLQLLTPGSWPGSSSRSRVWFPLVPVLAYQSGLSVCLAADLFLHNWKHPLLEISRAGLCFLQVKNTAHKSKVRENHQRARAQPGISRNRASLQPQQTSCQAVLDACPPIKSSLIGFCLLFAEFQRIEKRDKKAFLSHQCKEIEENNRMGNAGSQHEELRPWQRS